jgi:hypothetical protein
MVFSGTEYGSYHKLPLRHRNRLTAGSTFHMLWRKNPWTERFNDRRNGKIRTHRPIRTEAFPIKAATIAKQS